jgi:hypothetical protein
VNQEKKNRRQTKDMTITQWCQLLQISTKSRIYYSWTLTHSVWAGNSWDVRCSSLIFVQEKSFAVRHKSHSLARILLIWCLNSSLYTSYCKPMEIVTRKNNKSSVKSEISDHWHLTEERTIQHHIQVVWDSGTIFVESLF